LLTGSVSFATPDQPAPRAPALAAFTLEDRVNEDWLKWAPSLPVDGTPGAEARVEQGVAPSRPTSHHVR
jgi:hypothetical protein